MKFTLFTVILLVWMCVGETGDGPPLCCLTVSNTRIPVQNIEDYTIQESSGVCAIRAVRFLTRKNKIICSDPDSIWAKKVMKIVDGRTTTNPTLCFTSTTNMIPTTTTTHETPRLKTEISTTTTHDHPDCCLTVTNTRTPAEDIVDYHIQDSSLCPIRAVRFHTRKNRIICSDPDGSWAKRAMESVDRRMTPTDGPPATCCLKLRSTKVPLERVLNYRIQTKGLCPIKAVVIQTISGKSLCSDPNRTWTQRAMRKVDKGREQDPVPAEGASADRSRGRADPVTTTEPPLKRRQIRVKPRQKSKKEKSKTSTKAHKGPKEKRSERGGVKRKNKKGKN